MQGYRRRGEHYADGGGIVNGSRAFSSGQPTALRMALLTADRFFVRFVCMLHYFKFRQELADPVAGKEVYVKRGAGKGWPEECPPIRAANAFGFDLLANFDLAFLRKRGGGWSVEEDVVVESDFD